MDIQHVLVADYAEIVNGKLYLMGGGWDTYYAREIPVQMRVAVAIGVSIEWEETNQRIPVYAYLEDDDGTQLARIEASMQVGRPAELTAGSRQLSQLAANLSVNIKHHGGYRVRAIVGDEPNAKETTLTFRVAERKNR